MKVLVTGCAGFIGSHLAERLLREGFEVIGIDCFSENYPAVIKHSNLSYCSKSRWFRLISGSIQNMKSFPKVDIVFHLAAQSGVRRSWGGNFDKYLVDNVIATQRLLEWYKNKKIERFVFSSSSSVYGDTDSLPTSEESAKKPSSPYGATKLCAENLCHLYHKAYDLPAVILRYFTVYGPRQRPDMAFYMWTQALFNDKQITIYGDGTQTRDFTYINDIVQGTIKAALIKNIEGEVLNLGGSTRTSINDVTRNLINLLDADNSQKIYELPKRGDVRDTHADITKARNKLSYNPRVPIAEGLRLFVKWYKTTKFRLIASLH